MGKEVLRGDGSAVKVLASKRYNKGDIVYDGGFFGFAMGSASSGEHVVNEISQREYEFKVPSGLTALKGGILYISSAGVITETNTDRPFATVTQSKDANNYVWGILCPQVTNNS
jgi:predicted RecA/RadA family phage recombinase